MSKSKVPQHKRMAAGEKLCHGGEPKGYAKGGLIKSTGKSTMSGSTTKGGDAFKKSGKRQP